MYKLNHTDVCFSCSFAQPSTARTVELDRNGHNRVVDFMANSLIVSRIISKKP
jgi:hypothetical protein